MKRPDFSGLSPAGDSPEQGSELDKALRPRQKRAGRIAVIGAGGGLVTVFAAAITNDPELAFAGLAVVVGAPTYAGIDYIRSANAIEAAHSNDSIVGDELVTPPEEPAGQ